MDVEAFVIDLRSDTCSTPTPAMRRAMADAPVGDDVYGDDPTVKALEAETAALLGKEDAVYVPTGTMSNQIAVRSHTEPGDRVLFDHQAHVYLLEGGAATALAGVLPILLQGTRGIYEAASVTAAVGAPHRFMPASVIAPARLLCAEQTHNLGGGAVWPLDALHAAADAAHQAGLKTHLDGARLWHASAATGIDEARYAERFDTVSVCFSKALGAPVGSCLAGPRALTTRARRFKQQYGGGFRQAGIIAAGALHALREHRPRLAETHVLARQFAEGIARHPAIDLDLATVETNIVRFVLRRPHAAAFVEACHARGVHMLPSHTHGVRAVFYLNLTADDVAAAVAVVTDVLDRLATPALTGTRADRA